MLRALIFYVWNLISVSANFACRLFCFYCGIADCAICNHKLVFALNMSELSVIHMCHSTLMCCGLIKYAIKK